MEEIARPHEKLIDWRKLRRRISRTKSLTLPKRKPKAMPACVPLTNNNVTDVNANMERAAPPGNESKFSKIMTCLFFKKKTEVVDINKDSAKKKKMAVDRSERSRRVLQMESTKEAPTERSENGDQRPPSAGSHRMFLPSENPTAAFLSNLNPSVRRACSDVIRNTTNATSRPQTREAFTDEKRTVVRNTNYRGKQVSQSSNGSVREVDNKSKFPVRSKSQTLPDNRKPIVVPGANVLSEEDFEYNSDNEIGNLQDELKRMKLSHKDKRQSRRREGSISLSEGSLSDDGEDNNSTRPPNPSPIPQKQKSSDSRPPPIPPRDNVIGNRKTEKKSMEDVIDSLFIQTQHNIDTIYQNGLEKMDLEVYRADTATPETCMRKLEEDLMISPESPDSGVEAYEKPPPRPTVKSVYKKKKSEDETMTGDRSVDQNGQNEQGMDNLLNEVSVWAKDRQTWLLEDGKDREPLGKENTETSLQTDDYVIQDVKMSNNAKCNMWIESQTESESDPLSPRNKKTNGILTAPKLFRSANKHENQRNVSFSDKQAKHATGNDAINSMSAKNINLNDVSDDTDINSASTKHHHVSLKAKPNIDKGHSLAPWPSDMYDNKDDDDDRDRSTIDDDLSELDKTDAFRPRSPDSWLSSVCDYAAMLEKKDGSMNKEQNDSFEHDHDAAVWNGQVQKHTHVQRSATEPARSHQIIRQKPVIHAPFRNIEKHSFNFDNQYNPIPAVMPFMRNTQLRPLPASRPPRASQSFMDRTSAQNLPSMHSINSDNIFKGSRNMNEYEIFTMGSQAQRPFSEIPVRPDNIKGPDGYPAGAVASPRPNSETIPAKRSEKIGMGHVVATDSNNERKRYARDIVKSMQNAKPEPQDAFGDKAMLVEGNNESKPNKHKRHTVFNNNLITGGYKYDKHSRARAVDKSNFTGIVDPEGHTKFGNGENLMDSERQESMAPKHVDLKIASVSELDLTLKESRNYDRLRENGPENSDQKIYHSLHGNERFAEALKSQNMTGVRFAPGDQTRMNLSTGIGGRSTGRQVNGLEKPPSAQSSGSQKQTADRLKTLRSRRDMEMEWLMKDAAETEV